jgi:arylsulfatase
MRTLLVVGLGAGLGYVATGRSDTGSRVRAARASAAPATPLSCDAAATSAGEGCEQLGGRGRVIALAAAGRVESKAHAAQAAKRPNIVIIWGDDVGQSNISAYTMGLMGYRTPNIDRVAKEGIIFTDYYAEQSCTAGRASFITGQHGLRTGLTKVGLPGATLGLQKEDPTIADLLKPHGYATGQFGKNHLGDRNGFLPTVHGFDEFYGNLYHLNVGSFG